MFKVFVAPRKRSSWSTSAVALSVGAHLVAVGAVIAAVPAPRVAVSEGPSVIDLPIVPVPKPPLDPEPAPAPGHPAPDPSDPVPVPGETIALYPPAEVPDGIRAPNPDELPLLPADVSGLGTVGDYIGIPEVDSRPPTGIGATGPSPLDAWYPSAEAAEVVPTLTNRGEVDRLLRSNFPSLLRDSRYHGRVTLEFVIDENGRVIPETIVVADASHEAFGAAATRLVRQFRYRPALLGGEPLAVRVVQVIDWRSAHR